MNIHHICIQTNNYRESVDFYTKVLGFELKEETKDFHGRYYNSWLDLNGFMIELQTGKKPTQLNAADNESEGIAHFCLYSKTFDEDFNKIDANPLSTFKIKNGSKIYSVGENKLFKLIAPEGTIIEIRDRESI